MNEFSSKAPTGFHKGPDSKYRQLAKRILRHARFFSQATGMTAEVERELWSKVRQLRERLDGLKQSR